MLLLVLIFSRCKQYKQRLINTNNDGTEKCELNEHLGNNIFTTEISQQISQNICDQF